MGRIFGEVDAKNQAEKKITRLRQTSSVSAYTAEFKQLQARIDWDDAALRTVFEAGLKENVKDGLVHHDKPETLHALVELATRIDNRLWERNDQKKYFRPNVANTRRQRGRYDNDGDAIMTGKVQDKAKDRKTRRKFDDGLSKEERQKRYDNKACLRCGKEGHFRRDCPENDKGRQGAVKIGMIRQGTPYPREQSTDSDVSDMELYEEARLLDNATYELLPRAIEAKEITAWDEVQPTDLKVHAATVRQRLRDQQCWKCGWDSHLANECSHEGRIAVSGRGAKKAIQKAFEQQPYFEKPGEPAEAPAEPQAPQWRTPEHQTKHWMDCELKCRFHKSQRKATGKEVEADWHGFLEDNECQVKDCYRHPGKRGKNRAWEDASKDRPVEDEWYTKNVPTGQGPVPHELLHWTFCYKDNCGTHYDAKYGAGYFPRERKGKQSKN
jgi:hypothetical protein